jgi:hypothetical protein
MKHRLDQSTVAIPQGGYRARFIFPLVSSFHQTYETTKVDPVIFVLHGHFSLTTNLEVITLAQENHADIICLPPHNSHEMQPIG